MEQIFGELGHGDVVHFIGVGGIGMSGLAEVLARWGFTVQGSDLAEPYTVDKLREAGVQLFQGHDAAQVGGARLVVVSSAIKPDNVELAAAQKAGVRVVHRAEVLAEIMKNFSTVAVTGTHGKTSTTALIYTALKAAGLAVGIINGGVMNDVGSNVVLPPKKAIGKGWLVVEADESDASFLKLKPTVAVVTNIEPEHMSTYGSEEQLLQAFADFMQRATEVVACADDPNTLIAVSRLEGADQPWDVVTYGLADDADVYAVAYTPESGGRMAFDAVVRGGTLPDVVVNAPGAHSVQNSLAALAVAQLLKLDVTKAADGLAAFAGVGRRFTHVGTFEGAAVIDDYGHHPTEIATTLDAAKQVFAGRVVAVIQPHRFTRLRDLLAEFADCAKVADVVLVLPVYSAGESPIEGITHEKLAGLMQEQLAGLERTVAAVQDVADLRGALQELRLKAGDSVVFFGAGSSSAMAKQLVQGQTGRKKI